MVKSPKKSDSLKVAEYFVFKANSEGRPITNKKLQKLVYYAQVWSLVLHREKLFSDKIEAWVHGPAVKNVYIKYKQFGFNPIKKEADLEMIKSISEKKKKLLDDVWNVYGKFDAGYLEFLTHSEKPWQDAREGLQSSENSENEITQKSIIAFYSEKLRDLE